MARPLRINIAGGLYHVTARGNARKAIVRDDQDRQRFVDILEQMIEQYRVVCHGWVLMRNHYHLLLETPSPNLSLALRHLNGVYTQAFNRRHRQVGHVFQGRYKSIIVEKDAHLLELCRYLVLNPVRAKLVAHPRMYRWSSYRATAGEANIPTWLTIDWVLEQFCTRKRSAQQRYKSFVAEGMTQRVSPLDNVSGQVYLGSPTFIQRMQHFIQHGDDREIPQIQRRPTWFSATAILRLVARHYGESIRTIKQPTRRPSEARQVAVYGLRREGGLSLQTIGDELGLGYTAVSRGVARIAERMTNDPPFCKQIEQLFKRITKI